MSGPSPKRRPRQTAAGKERITVVVPSALADRIRATAARYGLPVGEVARRALDAGMRLAVSRLQRSEAAEARKSAQLSADLRLRRPEADA